MSDSQPLLRLSGITKTYPGVVANRNVDMDVRAGEIHAVLGENGAGKSTLMKIIYGATQPDGGLLEWRGEALAVRSPAHARSLGIGMVFQHFSLFETLTVVQNVSLAVPGNPADLARRIREVSEHFGLAVDPDALVHPLSVGERQRVEIIRCLMQSPRLLILDEPTSVLPPQGVKQLFTTLTRLAEEGCAILYISHKMAEIRTLCQRATILRHGEVTGEVDPRTVEEKQLAELMIGRDLPHPTHPPARADGEILLEVNGLSHTPLDPYGTRLRNVNLTVRRGEIVGIAGVSGNGQSELLKLISGEDQPGAEDCGTVYLGGVDLRGSSPIERRRRGLGFVPEERLGRGAVPSLSLAMNALLTGHEHGLTRWQLLRFAPIRAFAQACIATNDVRCTGHRATAASLSGGNLQKFIIGRELDLGPSLLVLSQPTWGIDVGAAAAIRQRLIDLRDDGVGILVVSEELDELFEVADRMYVMFDGLLSADIPAREATTELIGHWMTGGFEVTRSGAPGPGLPHVDASTVQAPPGGTH